MKKEQSIDETTKKLEKLKSMFNPVMPVKAILQYFHDFEHKIYDEVLLNEVPEAIELSSDEAIILKSPSAVKGGVPVYMCGRGFPISLDLSPNTERNALIESTMSSFQLLAWLKDTHITNLTKPKRSDNNVLYSALFAIVSAVFITLFITYIAWGG